MAANPDMSQIPAVKPPSGVQSDWNNSDNFKTENVILHSTVMAVVTIAVLIRVYTRAVVKKTFGVDDYFAVIAWALSLTQSIMFAYSTKLGFGMHLWDIRATSIVRVLKLFSATLKVYMPTILAVKLCLLLGYHRVFKVDRRSKWLIWIGVALNSAFYIAFFFLDIFRCRPMASAWNPAIKGKCIEWAFFPWTTGLFNIISDFYILAIPMPILAGMKGMDNKRRARLFAIFGLGLFTCVASIMRLVVTAQVAGDLDRMYAGARILHWPILEVNVGLICACAVTFPAFFDPSQPRSLGSFLSKFRKGSAKSSTSSGSLPDANKHANRQALPSFVNPDVGEFGELRPSTGSEKNAYCVSEESADSARGLV
ncbi:hypothetical protein K458DRAFT_408736 [Lentithecium fluviatile CBS 122367]|uniref:Rhodopsin domain-containing protein n=1 Tax=Lentithecium fluviatile CBS 122367 TaxID=1168545 RepID=A0A6G1IKB4_9PLEO|nr:hypothetical protein K458DRAFT_408736 [Lentithecium fluviatile CBS 122367]